MLGEFDKISVEKFKFHRSIEGQCSRACTSDRGVIGVADYAITPKNPANYAITPTADYAITPKHPGNYAITPKYRPGPDYAIMPIKD